MTVLNLADALYLGTRTVYRAYLGDEQVWPTVRFEPPPIEGFIGWWDAQQLPPLAPVSFWRPNPPPDEGLNAGGGPWSLGIRFNAEENVRLRAIWVYSDSDCTHLPEVIGLNDITQTPRWSGLAGSGWVRSPLDDPRPIPPTAQVWMFADTWNPWHTGSDRPFNDSPLTAGRLTIPVDTPWMAGLGPYNPWWEDPYAYWIDVEVDDIVPITVWPDASGNGNDLTSVGTNPPVYTDDTIHGHPAVIFDETQGQFFYRPMSPASDLWTVIFVATPHATGSPYPVTVSTSNLSVFVSNVGGGVWVIYSTWAGEAFGSVIAEPNRTDIVAAVLAGGNSAIYVNGTYTRVNTAAPPMDDFAVGIEWGHGNPWHGNVGEVIVYPRALDRNELRVLDNWLYRKWFVQPPPVTGYTAWWDAQQYLESVSSFRGQPQRTGLGAGGSPGAVDSRTFVLGIAFDCTRATRLNAVWFYSPPGSTILPGQIVLYAGGAPWTATWATANWSGPVGSGWVRAEFPNPPMTAVGENVNIVGVYGFGGAWFSWNNFEMPDAPLHAGPNVYLPPETYAFRHNSSAGQNVPLNSTTADYGIDIEVFDPVTSWPDASGRNTLEAVAAAPAYVTAGINGHPAIDFNTTPMRTAIAAPVPQANNYTYVVLCQWRPIWSAFNLMGGPAHSLLGANPDWLLWSNGQSIRTATGPTANPAVLAAVFGGGWGGSLLYRDGVVWRGDTNVLDLTGFMLGDSPSNTTNPLTPAGANWVGPVGEVLIYPRALTVDELYQLHEYLRVKWDLTTRPPQPPPVPGAVAWWDAQHLNLPDWASITTWPDLSGNRSDLTATGIPPVFAHDAINGHPAVATNRDQTRMTAPLPGPGDTTATVVCVGRVDAFDTDHVQPWILGASSNLYSHHAGPWSVYALTTAVTGIPAVPGTYILAVSFNHANSILLINGTHTSISVSTADWGRFEAAWRWTGALGEIIVYPRALTGSELTDLYIHLADKWDFL